MFSVSDLNDEVQLRRKLVLTPCASKDGLRTWMRMYLKFDCPDHKIDDESTGSPMDTIWEVYHAGISNAATAPSRFMWYASRDSFKCQAKGTKILTRSNGLRNIEDVRLGDVIWSGWDWRSVTDWVHDGVKDGVRVELEDGREFTGSPVHRVWTWSTEGLPAWKRMSELGASDLVMVDAGATSPVGVADADDYESGYVLGIVAGDGCLTVSDRAVVSTMDEVVLKAWKRFCVKVSGFEPRRSKSRPCDYIGRASVHSALVGLGCTTAHSYDKRAPHSAFRSLSAMAGFLSGLLDTDGTVTNKNNVEVVVTSKGLLQDSLLMLNALGVNAYVRSNPRTYSYGYVRQNHVAHHLVIKAREFNRLAAAGVVIRAKKAGAIRGRNGKTKDTHDSVPVERLAPLLSLLPKVGGRWKKGGLRKPVVSSLYPAISREKLSSLLTWAEAQGTLSSEELVRWRFIADHKWVKPAKVERCVADFYDLTVKEDHSYWSNGVVSHNTLGATCLEVLAMLHMKRSVVHMASIEQQSEKAAEYYKKFLDMDDIAEFKVGDNKRTVAVCWFDHLPTGNILTLAEWKQLGGRSKAGDYRRHVYYIKVLVNTPQSANCVDPGTPVLMVDGTSKPIKELRRGDVVRSFDVRGGAESVSVVGGVHTTFKQSMRLHFDNGVTQVLSEDHPVMTLRGWRRARALRLSDVLLNAPETGAIVEREELRTVVVPLACHNPESALVGTLLGDASMVWPSGKNGRYGRGPRISISHCDKQSEYLKRKLGVVHEIGVDAHLCNFSSDSKIGQNRVVSETSERLAGLFNLFYGSGRKAITPELVKKIDEEALAFWFMDDGSGNRESGLGHDRNVSFATCSFTVEENRLLIDHLQERFGLVAKLGKTSNGKKTYPILILDLSSSRKLAAIIDKHVSPCVRYKLPRYEGLLDSRCIECDEPVPFSGNDVGNGFARCAKHDGETSEWRRKELRELRKRFTRRVVKVEYLGVAELCDVFMSSGPHNFFANHGILLHNSDHVAFMVVDEVDLIRYPKAYREALFIPTTMKDEDGVNQPPITLLTSSRKSAGGLVQEEINNAEERGTAIRHHNVLDVTARCPDSRHRPDKPKLRVLRSNETLKTILPEDLAPLQAADPKKAESYVEDEAYWGCYHSCKIFAGCRGLLARQTSTAAALKPEYDTIRKWKEIGDIEMVKAQLLCWKPGNVGAIYANFSRTANMFSMDRMWEEVTGEKPLGPVTKGALIEMFMKRGHPAVGGMDFGFTHCFAVVVGFVVGRRLYITDAFEIPELEPHQCVEVCDRRIKFLSPLLWPDTAYPAYIKMFRSSGYRCREHTKDVVGGIEAVRKKIAPAGMDPELYLIKGDEGCELLAKRVEGYRWKEDSTGRPTDVPRDVEDDLDDALRYMVQNTFDRSSGIIIAKGIAANIPDDIKNAKPVFPTPQQQMAAKIHELTGGEAGSTIGMPAMVVLGPGETFDPNRKRFKRGGFFASFD